jgi:hypothetical protein
MPLEKTLRALNVSPDGQELFCTDPRIDTVQVLDIASRQIVGQIPTSASPHLPSPTPDGHPALLSFVAVQGRVIR